jgi:hypothetical protein
MDWTGAIPARSSYQDARIALATRFASRQKDPQGETERAQDRRGTVGSGAKTRRDSDRRVDAPNMGRGNHRGSILLEAAQSVGRRKVSS